MEHRMHLNGNAFNLVRDGLKTVELRIGDPKRKKITCGDLIHFQSLENPDENITVWVFDVKAFGNFSELFQSVSPVLGGWDEGTPNEAAAEEMIDFYSELGKAEALKEYGVVAIFFEIF